MMRAMLHAVLCSLATSHECRSGALQCTTVLNTEHHPARSESTHGVNLCTPDGQVLRCLLGHGYHNRNCAENEAACCADGSFPDNFVASNEIPHCHSAAVQQGLTEHSQHPAGTDSESSHLSGPPEHIRRGSLLLKIAAATEDALSKLRSEGARSVIKAVLRELSGAESVILQSVFYLPGSGRRLAAASDFKLSFEAHGHHWHSIAVAGLLAALQNGFDELAVGLKVVSATVEWEDVEKRNYVQLQVVVIAIVSAVVFVMAVVGAWLVKRRARRVATQAGTGAANVSDKDNESIDVESASTGTGSLSDEASLTDSEKHPSAAAPAQIVPGIAI